MRFAAAHPLWRRVAELSMAENFGKMFAKDFGC
jgi:hypothetical protein